MFLIPFNFIKNTVFLTLSLKPHHPFRLFSAPAKQFFWRVSVEDLVHYLLKNIFFSNVKTKVSVLSSSAELCKLMDISLQKWRTVIDDFNAVRRMGKMDEWKWSVFYQQRVMLKECRRKCIISFCFHLRIYLASRRSEVKQFGYVTFSSKIFYAHLLHKGGERWFPQQQFGCKIQPFGCIFVRLFFYLKCFSFLLRVNYFKLNLSAFLW